MITLPLSTIGNTLHTMFLCVARVMGEEEEVTGRDGYGVPLIVLLFKQHSQIGIFNRYLKPEVDQ